MTWSSCGDSLRFPADPAVHHPGSAVRTGCRPGSCVQASAGRRRPPWRQIDEIAFDVGTHETLVGNRPRRPEALLDATQQRLGMFSRRCDRNRSWPIDRVPPGHYPTSPAQPRNRAAMRAPASASSVSKCIDGRLPTTTQRSAFSGLPQRRRRTVAGPRLNRDHLAGTRSLRSRVGQRWRGPSRGHLYREAI